MQDNQPHQHQHQHQHQQIIQNNEDDEVTLITVENEELVTSLSVASMFGVLRPLLASHSTQQQESTSTVVEKGKKRFHVDAGCLVLDHMLYYLQLYLSGQESRFEFDMNKLDEMQAMAEKLDSPVVVNYCQKNKQRIQEACKRDISWEEYCQHQSRSDFWILIDGLVYDISKWINPNPTTNTIPHPGGTTPLQTYQEEATYLFEIYHATNECYHLLKNFFVGRLKEEDLNKVPPMPHPPSAAFYAHLRSFTNQWMKPQDTSCSTATSTYHSPVETDPSKSS